MTKYRICKRCVMDTTDPDIQFDENGVCNHCRTFENRLKSRILSKENAEKQLSKIIDQIKKEGKNKKYDCIIGVSGGLDSTFTAYMVKKLGLRPLAVHLDNGWNSELAVNNITKTLKTLGIDLITYVIDWEEFKGLQLAFLKASTPDGEIPTDHAISAFLYDIAAKNGIRHVISGFNFRTEGIMPATWSYGHFDWKYIKGIHDLFETSKLKSYPHYSLLKLFYYSFIKKIRVLAILNYIEFDKNKAMQILEREIGWKYYGGKHCESIYTKFYQSYLLPVKFNIDKRKAHLSSIICSIGDISRETALEELKKLPYDQNQIQEEKEYVIKKFGLTEQEYEEILSLPIKTFNDYRNNYKLIKFYKEVFAFFRKLGVFYK